MCVLFPTYSCIFSQVFLESSDPLSPQALLISTNPSCVGGKEAVPTIRSTMVWNIFSSELTVLLTHLSKPSFVIPPSSGVCESSLRHWVAGTVWHWLLGGGGECCRRAVLVHEVWVMRRAQCQYRTAQSVPCGLITTEGQLCVWLASHTPDY